MRLSDVRNPTGTEGISTPRSKHDDEYEQTQRRQPPQHSPLHTSGATIVSRTQATHGVTGNVLATDTPDVATTLTLPFPRSQFATHIHFPFITSHHGAHLERRSTPSSLQPTSHTHTDAHAGTHTNTDAEKCVVFHDHSPAQRTAVLSASRRGSANPLALCNGTADGGIWRGGADYAMVPPQCALSLVITKLHGWCCASKRALSVWTLGHVSPYLDVGVRRFRTSCCRCCEAAPSLPWWLGTMGGATFFLGSCAVATLEVGAWR